MSNLVDNLGVIVAARMVSGEEVITRLGDRSGNCQIFERPRILTVVNKNGQQGLALIPWFLSDPDGSPNVSNDTIMAILTVPKHIADGYLEEVSGIALAR